MQDRTMPLAAFASLNPRGRALFLGIPIIAAAVAHVLALACIDMPEVGAFTGCVAAGAAFMGAAWLWLDEPFAVAIERVCMRCAFLGIAAGMAVALADHVVGFAVAAAALASFGALAGLVRITAYSEAPDATAPQMRLAAVAWTLQAVSISSVLSARTVPVALLAAALPLAVTVFAATRRQDHVALALE